MSEEFIHRIPQERAFVSREGHQLNISRTSSDSAEVTLLCGLHEHEPYIVGKIEGETGWGVGRKTSGYTHGDTFLEAVEHSAVMLLEECNAIVQLDAFFAGS